jgi:hypothetical protein
VIGAGGGTGAPTGLRASAAPAMPASTTTHTLTVTSTPHSRTVTATVTRTPPARTAPAVAAVLAAWSEPGPQPGNHAAAMRRLRTQWPTLAKALEGATGVGTPAVAVEPRPVVAVPPPVKAEEPEPTAACHANCSAARAAGAAPLRVGEPGYRSALDRDGDGVACE